MEISATSDSEVVNRIPMHSERIEIHRLFYVNHDDSSSNKEYKIAGDAPNISKVTRALHQLDPNKEQLFGIFGETIALESRLLSLFPHNHTQIQSILSKLDSMPAIWTVYNNMKFVFLLISTHETNGERENSFMIVMQRLLQDICENILICPSDLFFTNFSIEHSFHGKPHDTRTYRQVKKERIDIQPPQNLILDDKNIFKTLLIEQSGRILITNNTPTTYCYQKHIQEPSLSSSTSKFNELKNLLNIHLDISTLSLRLILKLCEQCEIFLSKSQELQIGKLIGAHTKIYDEEKLTSNKLAKSLIKDLLRIEGKFVSYLQGIDRIDNQLRVQLYNETTDWLINPVCIDENAGQFSARLTAVIYSHKSNKNERIHIEPDRLGYFTSDLKRIDKKEKMRQTQENLLQYICVAVQSENQFTIHYDIHRLLYNPINDADNHLQGFSVTCLKPIKISLNDLSLLVNLSDLSESDRLDFSKQIEIIACFTMNDRNSEILVIKRPDIVSRTLRPSFGYGALLYKNGIFRKITDFYLPSIHVAYAFNQNSHTLVVYNILTGSVTRCSLDEHGQLQSSVILHLRDRSKKPCGVTSLALTTAQDLLILIDSNFSVCEIDISQEDTATVSLLIKNRNTSDDKPNFTADNGDLYQVVQTIGETNPVFFFQAKSCIDIIDQNYCQIYSIKIVRHSLLYHMQTFTDFIDTYCVLFDGTIHDVYCIQNLVSDTRIERQDSNTNLQKLTKPYVGNRLLDIIKHGEVQFGVPDSVKKTQYHVVLPPEYSEFSNRITKYHEDLKLRAQLKIGYEESDLLCSSINIDQLIKTVVSRVPLQLCTIEMGNLVPLNNGRRDKMDHLSSQSFRIEMKAREISFAFLDHILSEIDANIKIIGVIGRQSTGKSYLMNRIFRTRFGVAAGRCTDGIWMSYAFVEETHFLILDCEGLFSDQRTEDEEIKLIAFLSAVCDVTILSQDLGFSRFQDRLFSVLSQAVDKIGINDKLFKGILLVAVRDISDSNADESFEATEEKFSDLQKKGKSGFLEQLYSKTFKVQLLHHFENTNFDYEIQNLRQTFIKHVMLDENTRLPLPCRWDNGKDIADRLKILLVQLYTDDFIDSNDIHAGMKLAELEDEMKRLWTKFDVSEEEYVESNEQQIEKLFEDKLTYSLQFHHTHLELEENSSDSNLENICKFILAQLYSVTDLAHNTKEENNRLFFYVNELIPDVMSYRRQQVKQLILKRFQKKFPKENDHIKERKTKFIDAMERYMLSFTVQICLKNCSLCNLKCIHNAQHTEETKALLKTKKDELTKLQVSLKNTTAKNIEESIKRLNNDIITAATQENELHKEMIRLFDELKYLSEKEKLETDISKCSSELAIETTKIDALTARTNEIHGQVKSLLLIDEDLKDADQLLYKLDEDIQQQINPSQYQTDHLNQLIEQFHQNSEINCDTYKNGLLCFSVKPEQTDDVESMSNTLSLSKMMTDNVVNISNYRIFIQQCLENIKDQLNTEQQRLGNSETRLKEIEQQIIDGEKQKQDTTDLIETKTTECEKLKNQLAEIIVEQETLSKELNEEKQLVETKTSLEMQTINRYKSDLQDQLNTDEIKRRTQNLNMGLQFFLKEKFDKESKIAKCKQEIDSETDDSRIKELHEQVNKDEGDMIVLMEKIQKIQNSLESNEKEVVRVHDQQQLKEELTEVNQLVETMHSYGQETEETHAQSFKTTKKKDLTEKIKKLKEVVRVHGQLNEELTEVNQLVETMHSYDQEIEETRAQLLKTMKKKNLTENIKKLKEAELEDCQTEENTLTELSESIGNIQIALKNIIEKKTYLCNNSSIMMKIVHDPRYDVYQQQEKKRNRLTELLESSRQLAEHIEQLQNSLSIEEDRLTDQNQDILNIKQNFHLEKTGHNIHLKNVQTTTELNRMGIELAQSLSETETSLIAASEKLDQLFQSKALTQEYISSRDKLELAINERNRLAILEKDFNEQLDKTKNNNATCRYTNSQVCKERYDTIIQMHDSAHSLTKKLEQELSNMDIYTRVKDEITTLEREAQINCHCATDHKCSGICRICSEEDKTKQNKCMFSAGHAGDHTCNAGHVCTRFCQICEIYGFSNNRCCFAYEHAAPEHHQCERTHQCPATCFCSEPCAIPLGLKKHEEHRCNKKECWKLCMFSCGNRCVADDHNHDATAETVSITIDNVIHQMKKHLCNQQHYCRGICDRPGVCEQAYKTQTKKWTTESGIEFEYDHIEVEDIRAKCGIKIDIGKTSHDKLKYHSCDGQHTCPERCPDCGSFCRNLYGHDGRHRTVHRNKDQHIFTSTDPNETIEIHSEEHEEGRVRIYKVGESAKPENCSVSCKRRGRAHFHLIECPGDSRCWQNVLGNKAKHSNDTYYYGPDHPSTQKYDQILCSAYWSMKKWSSPLSDTDQKTIDACNTYCDKHIERDKNGNILKESVKGLCTLDAWHIGDHVFECRNDHPSLETYQGIDVCFVIDTTGSMARYFEKVKETITCIIRDNQVLMKKLRKTTSDFRFAIVDYRDHPPEGDYVFHTCDFTTETLVSKYVGDLKSGSGGDFPEAVLDALDAACALKWRDKADRLLFHILDAPPHGKMYHSEKDEKWPAGCPCGRTAQGVLQIMKKKNIQYHVLRCSNFLNMMITEFKKYIEVKTLTFDDKITFEGVIAKQVYQQLIDTEMTLKKA